MRVGTRSLRKQESAHLEHTHVGGERGLVPHSGRDAAQQRRHLSSCLGEAEDVVHEEKHVLPLGVPEVLQNRAKQKYAPVRRGENVG